MFCAPGLVFGGTEDVLSRFHVFLSRTYFWRYRGRLDNFHVLRSRSLFRRYRGSRVPFSCFALPNSFAAVPRASGPVFKFSTPGLVFGGIEGVGSRFQVLRSQTHYRRYQGRPILFSCFPLPDMCLAVPRASGPVFHVLRSRTHFPRNRGRCPLFIFCAPGLVFHVTEVDVHFSCFALPNLFSAVPRASGPVFMFCAPRLVFGGIVGVRSRFQVLRSRNRFRRYRERPIPFSCFPLPDIFLAVPRASVPVFMFCAPKVVFGRTEVVGSIFNVLRSRIRFRRYRGCRVPFSCFAFPDSFSAVPRVSCPVFMFCVSGLIFGGTEGVGSLCHIIRSRTYFWRY
jgi:hypothetical protein